MAGLIPLRLPAAASASTSSTPTTPVTSFRASIAAFPIHASPPRPGSHVRHASAGAVTQFPHAKTSPSARSPRVMNRPLSQALISIPVLPYTAAEWRRTMAGIKRQHMSKRFRSCSARCAEILERLKDTSSVEPAHLIYLHFYAANSFEATARQYPSTLPARGMLLSKARQHYDTAAALINEAELMAGYLTRSSSRASATWTGDSMHSPSGSTSSGTWSSPTASSPTNSVCSYDDLMSKTSGSTVRRRKAKKTVSFQLPKDEKFLFPVEPIIRPDSPTLGFEDSYFSSPILSKALPEPPKRPVSPEFQAARPDPHAPMPRRSSMRNWISCSTGFGQADEETQRAAQCVHRYCEALTSLKYQVQAHRSDLDVLLDDPTGQARKDELLAAAMSGAMSPTATMDCEEIRAMDRKARIERLRQNGWQRKRFDASRYERLCNDVLAEIS